MVVFNRGRGMGQRVPNDHLEPMVLVKYARATPDGGRLSLLSTLSCTDGHQIHFVTMQVDRMMKVFPRRHTFDPVEKHISESTVVTR